MAFEGTRPVFATLISSGRPQPAGQGARLPHADRQLPHPREARHDDDGWRRRVGRPVLDRRRALGHVLPGQLRPSRRVLARPVRQQAQPRLREHVPGGRAHALRVDRSSATARVARRLREGRSIGHAHRGPRRLDAKARPPSPLPRRVDFFCRRGKGGAGANPKSARTGRHDSRYENRARRFRARSRRGGRSGSRTRSRGPSDSSPRRTRGSRPCPSSRRP